MLALGKLLVVGAGADCAAILPTCKKPLSEEAGGGGGGRVCASMWGACSLAGPLDASGVLPRERLGIFTMNTMPSLSVVKGR